MLSISFLSALPHYPAEPPMVKQVRKNQEKNPPHPPEAQSNSQYIPEYCNSPEGCAGVSKAETAHVGTGSTRCLRGLQCNDHRSGRSDARILHTPTQNCAGYLSGLGIYFLCKHGAQTQILGCFEIQQV